MENSRSFWDNLKYILILCVVVGNFTNLHMDSPGMAQSLYLFIFSFHIPLFIFIMGFMHENVMIRKKVFNWITLGYVMKVIFAVAKLMKDGNVKFNFLSESEIPWLLFAMAAFVGLTYLFRNTDQWLVLSVAVLLGCLAGYETNIGDVLVLSRIVVFFPFYQFGHMIAELCKEKTIKIPVYIRLLAIVLILAWGMCCILKANRVEMLHFLFDGNHPYTQIHGHYGWFYRLTCYGIACVMGAALICVTPTVKLPVITLTGSRFLQIYLFHYLLIYFLKYMGLHKFFSGNKMREICWLALAVIVVHVLGSVDLVNEDT